jgi:hypothetical protein
MHDWIAVGAQCVYRHKAPYGLPTEHFKAEVLALTPTGKVRIRAYDHINQSSYVAAVSRASLSPVEDAAQKAQDAAKVQGFATWGSLD